MNLKKLILINLKNDKIGISKTRISDTQSTLSELNIQMDSIKKNLEKKSNEYEIIDRHVKVKAVFFF